MKYGLKDEVIDRLLAVFKFHPEIEKVILYGSRAKGNFKPSSDIDLTLVGNNVTLDVLNKVNEKLDNLMMPHTIDVSIYKHIKQNDLLDHIKRVGITFYQAEE